MPWGPSVGPDQTEGKEGEAENTYALQQWLEEVYFDEGKKADLNRDDIHQVGRACEKDVMARAF